jgi:hypothetical protein
VGVLKKIIDVPRKIRRILDREIIGCSFYSEELERNGVPFCKAMTQGMLLIGQLKGL